MADFPRFVSESKGTDSSFKNCLIEGSETMCSLTKEIGYIPEVSHTFKYFDGHYGLMNEKGVAIGESTCGAKIVAKMC